ncbi:MAG TPA: thiamine pyrophosphate-dependent enzyme, partial [Hyphomonadaceae bacterium]|nr:thiamine pyrophosphate-dependent enzyme [Hyphomonadaceae bacterium]
MSDLKNLPSQKDAIAAALKLYDKRPFAVSDIGSQTAWLKAASHDARNLYVSGPMGLASSVALGVAACRPNEQVLALCGDGALAMNLSSLVTIQGARQKNLAILLL